MTRLCRTAHGRWSLAAQVELPTVFSIVRMVGGIWKWGGSRLCQEHALMQGLPKKKDHKKLDERRTSPRKVTVHVCKVTMYVCKVTVVTGNNGKLFIKNAF